jgi:U3 small nucleolar RNA-associated protein 20
VKYEYIKFAESTLIPCIRTGLKAENQGARRSFIQLICEVAKNFSNETSPYFHGDLNILIHDNEPDIDFFMNLLHVQVHRRTRAVIRLRKILETHDESNNESSCSLSTLTLTSILLPLLLHPIYECILKEDENFAVEATTTIGIIARKLPKGKYQRFLWSTLLKFCRYPNKERLFLALICSLIDAFHFKIERSMWEQDVQKQVKENDRRGPNAHSENTFFLFKIIPKIEGLLVKKAPTGSKVSSSLRCQLVLPLMKLLQKISEEMLESKFSRYISLLCDALKCRESDERDQARSALAKVATSFDLKFIPSILREVAVTLTEGYQLHVRAACLHSILISLVQSLENDLSINHIRFHIDNSLPAMMVRPIF